MRVTNAISAFPAACYARQAMPSRMFSIALALGLALVAMASRTHADPPAPRRTPPRTNTTSSPLLDPATGLMVPPGFANPRPAPYHLRPRPVSARASGMAILEDPPWEWRFDPASGLMMPAFVLRPRRAGRPRVTSRAAVALSRPAYLDPDTGLLIPAFLLEPAGESR
jgi:hypothetical protein